MDYTGGDYFLAHGGHSFEVFISPYSLACQANAELLNVSTITELEKCRCKGKLLLMKGEICEEQLMPKNFIFYNPNHHKEIYKLLEEKKPAGIITATQKQPELVGALYPFPLIVDGDFNIPCVYCTDIVGREIARKKGEVLRLSIESKRIPATACNVIACKNFSVQKEIVICAHIDAYEDSPGASDNASGTVVLLLLGQMLARYQGNTGIEIVAFNGEDHYSAGGEMDYLKRYGVDVGKIILTINIDDVGYQKGKTNYSFYECSHKIVNKINKVLSCYAGIQKGGQWFNGDHMLFVQQSKPAMAFTAEYCSELMSSITHTAKDRPEIIDCAKLVEVAEALKGIIVDF